MNIVEFFELSSGKWFSLCTSHYLTLERAEEGKSDVVIVMLAKSDPDVIALCQACQVNSDLALCGVRATSESTLDFYGKKKQTATLLVPIADSEQASEGQFLRQLIGPGLDPMIGRYSLGSDDALTLINEADAKVSEERLWFASPNLRLRTSLLRGPDGFSVTSFYSEIRMGVKPQQ